MSDSPDWAAFQARFLEVLQCECEAPRIVRELLATDLTPPQREWIEAMRPEMLETAAALVKKWGRRE